MLDLLHFGIKPRNTTPLKNYTLVLGLCFIFYWRCFITESNTTLQPEISVVTFVWENCPTHSFDRTLFCCIL